MNKNKVKTWVKKHESELLVLGSAVIGTVGVVLLAENWGAVKSAFTNTRHKPAFIPPKATNLVTAKIEEMPKLGKPVIRTITVREHTRLLPTGRHPSVSKVTMAAEYGIKLADNQTLVSSYSRSYVA